MNNMNNTKFNFLEYFEYNLIKILDEFDHYFSTYKDSIPTYIQSTYHYFAFLGERSIQFLIKNQGNGEDVRVRVPVLDITKKIDGDDLAFMLKSLEDPIRINYIALLLFPTAYFESFLYYAKHDIEEPLIKVVSKIPIIRDNIKLIESMGFNHSKQK